MLTFYSQRARLRAANEEGVFDLLFVDIGSVLTIELQEQCYDNLRISKNAWDTNLIKVRRNRRQVSRNTVAYIQ